MSRFRWLSGDLNWTDYGGKWYRHEGDTAYTVVAFDSWENLCGDVSDAKYNVQVSTIYLDSLARHEALRSCGWHESEDGRIINTHDGAEVCDRKHAHLAILEAMHGYGAKDVESDYSGNNAYAMLRQAGVTSPNGHLRRPCSLNCSCATCTIS